VDNLRRVEATDKLNEAEPAPEFSRTPTRANANQQSARSDARFVITARRHRLRRVSLPSGYFGPRYLANLRG
jgi:hypothetical protein